LHEVEKDLRAVFSLYIHQLRLRHGLQPSLGGNESYVLVENGFEMVIPHTTNFGWTIVSKVSKAAVYRGEIGFKQTEGLDATTYYLPKEETVMRIEDLLRSTYPKVEIAVMVLAFTIIIWGSTIFFGLNGPLSIGM